MKEIELRNELKETIKDVENLTILIKGNIRTIDKLGRKLLEELQKIEGWKILLEDNSPSPDFSRCDVCYDTFNRSIIFKEDGYKLLTIYLGFGLREQVESAKKRDRYIERELPSDERRWNYISYYVEE